LAVYGNVKSPKGVLRHDANVTTVTGVEVDYDGEQVPMDDAASRIAAAGIEALFYSSPSSRPEAPRWRALFPTAVEYPPEYRASLTETVHSILGGILAPESFTLSQAFYIGAVDGVPYHARHVPGQPLDTLHPPTP